MKTLFISILLFCTLSSVAYAANDSLIAHHIIKAGVGCYSEDDFDRFMSYAVSNDNEAMNSMAGRCFVLKKGSVVYLEDFRITGKVNLRMRGKTSTFWTVREMID